MVPSQSLLNLSQLHLSLLPLSLLPLSLLHLSLLHLSPLHSTLLYGLRCEGISIVKARLRRRGYWSCWTSGSILSRS
jgi:hypothetical protein